MGRVPGRWPTGDGSPRPPGRTSDHPQDQRQDLPYPSGQKRGQSGLREGGRRSFSIPTPTGGQSVTPHLAPSRPPNWYPFSPPPTPAGDIGQEERNSAPPQAATVKDGTIEAEYRAESWQAIEISFLSDERIQIRCGPQIETRNYGELVGFADRRNGKPNQAWVMLRAMAEAKGLIRDAAKAGRDWPRVENRMQEIRKALREHFAILADPVPYIEGAGYQARFKIGCAPSFHT